MGISATGASSDVVTSHNNYSRLNMQQQGAWFAVWTRSRHEQLVCKELAARHIQTFLPTFAEISLWKDRRKRILWPLFPGYCFARFDLTSLLTVLNCDGVVRVLSNGSKPVAVPDDEIAALQCLVASGLTFGRCALVAGMPVRVVNGPLSGVVGRVERKGPQDQVILTVDLLNSGARVQVAFCDLELL
jgi:transcriptional antiterminator NusG